VKITYSPPASAEDATGLPVDRLGLHLLRGFAESNGLHSRNAMFQGAKHAYVHNEVEPKLRAAALRGLVEAFDWLHHQGLLARDPEQSGDFYFITRLGQQALDAPDGLALVRGTAAPRRRTAPPHWRADPVAVLARRVRTRRFRSAARGRDSRARPGRGQRRRCRSIGPRRRAGLEMTSTPLAISTGDTTRDWAWVGP
jgi:hypothetical protein